LTPPGGPCESHRIGKGDESCRSTRVACVAPDTLTLKVRARSGTGPETTVTGQPARLGANLWIAVLTAGAPGGAFAPGQVYEYELTAPWEATRGTIPWGDLSLGPAATRPTLPPDTAFGPPASQLRFDVLEEIPEIRT
jgi:hypothetical protein